MFVAPFFLRSRHGILLRNKESSLRFGVKTPRDKGDGPTKEFAEPCVWGSFSLSLYAIAVPRTIYGSEASNIRQENLIQSNVPPVVHKLTSVPGLIRKMSRIRIWSGPSRNNVSVFITPVTAFRRWAHFSAISLARWDNLGSGPFFAVKCGQETS